MQIESHFLRDFAGKKKRKKKEFGKTYEVAIYSQKFSAVNPHCVCGILYRSSSSSPFSCICMRGALLLSYALSLEFQQIQKGNIGIWVSHKQKGEYFPDMVLISTDL